MIAKRKKSIKIIKSLHLNLNWKVHCTFFNITGKNPQYKQEAKLQLKILQDILISPKEIMYHILGKHIIYMLHLKTKM